MMEKVVWDGVYLYTQTSNDCSVLWLVSSNSSRVGITQKREKEKRSEIIIIIIIKKNCITTEW